MVDLWQAYDKLRRNLWKTYEIHKILCKSGPRETSEQTVWIRWREPQISNQTHLFGSPTDGVVMVMRTSSTQSCAKFSCQTDTADCHQLNEKQHKLTYQRLDSGVDGLKSLRLTPKLFDWLVDALQFFDSNCDAANLKIFPADLSQSLWAPRKRDSFPVDKILHMPLSCLRCLWSNLVTLPSRHTAPYLAGSGAAPQ